MKLTRIVADGGLAGIDTIRPLNEAIAAEIVEWGILGIAGVLTEVELRPDQTEQFMLWLVWEFDRFEDRQPLDILTARVLACHVSLVLTSAVRISTARMNSGPTGRVKAT